MFRRISVVITSTRPPGLALTSLVRMPTVSVPYGRVEVRDPLVESALAALYASACPARGAWLDRDLRDQRLCWRSALRRDHRPPGLDRMDRLELKLVEGKVRIVRGRLMEPSRHVTTRRSDGMLRACFTASPPLTLPPRRQWGGGRPDWRWPAPDGKTADMFYRPQQPLQVKPAMEEDPNWTGGPGGRRTCRGFSHSSTRGSKCPSIDGPRGPQDRRRSRARLDMAQIALVEMRGAGKLAFGGLPDDRPEFVVLKTTDADEAKAGS